MKTIYLLFAILGTLIPCAFFGQFVLEQGIDLAGFVRQLFANSPASGFTADLLITSAVFWIWSFREARRIGMGNWWVYVALNLGVGLSCALPLFLFFRQIQVESAELEQPAVQPWHSAAAQLPA